MASIAEIAAKLTKAQRGELRRTYPRHAVVADWRVWPGLKRKGLLVVAGTARLELTPLGLEVRRILQEQSNGGK